MDCRSERKKVNDDVDNDNDRYGLWAKAKEKKLK